jgi:MFS family permease
MKFTKVALLTGYHLLGVGIGGILFVPSSRIWGKRHAFLLGNIIIIFSATWGGASGKNYNSALAARIFQGIGLAPFESLANAIVGDLFYVHERGKRMALTNFAVFGGSFLTPVIVGKMVKEIGWPWSFYFVAIFAGVLFPFMVFFVPETAYHRDDSLNTDMGVVLGNKLLVAPPTTATAGHGSMTETPESSAILEHDAAMESVQVKNETRHSHSAHGESPEASEKGLRTRTAPPPKATYWQSIQPFNGRKSDESFIKLFFRPFPLFCHPAIMWAMLIQGTLIGWTVFLGIVLAAIMLGPPLFFNQVKTGYMYTGAFIGALVGFLISGVMSDLIPQWMTRRNGGRYEPEFRLVLVIPQLVLGCAGLYGFGITANDTARYGWFWPDFFFALEVAGMVCGAVASSLYIVDAHRNIAIEAFTCMIVFKNIFSFGLTFSGYDWLADNGIKHVFMYTASVQLGVCLLTIPLCKLLPPFHSNQAKANFFRDRYFWQEEPRIFPSPRYIEEAEPIVVSSHLFLAEKGQICVVFSWRSPISVHSCVL